MTIFDLLFIALFFAAICTLIFAAVIAIRGSGARALVILRRLGVCAASYLAIVYAATALSKPVVLRIGDPECSDDWCLAVNGVRHTPKGALTVYDVELRIFSRARRVAQRENIATDVYLVDARWRRYDPRLKGDEAPLNTLLQPGESVTTARTFELPSDAHSVGLMIGYHMPLPICLIIGECGAFHKGPVIRFD